MIELRKTANDVRIGNVVVGGDNPRALIAGPCAIENRESANRVAEKLAEATQKRGIPFIFKGSFDKANRLSIDSSRGIGIDRGLEILAGIREKIGVPVLTDIHNITQVSKVAEYVDCLQIPAFLCRQTDLVIAAAKSGKPVNIKKGQFLAPEDMAFIADKAEKSNAAGILLTERGTSFGYNNLVVDFRSVPIMAETGYPIVMDVSHCQQKPGSESGFTGGSREFIPHIAIATLALGVDAIYIEVHPDPENAISDRKTQWPLVEIEEFLSFIEGYWGR
ncbi:3-deoxy-8-phosphooctulonate synthase [bacterium]|nr:MAG: 3-deoxy-8-phosphooctulonate synthase [bacterium]